MTQKHDLYNHASFQQVKFRETASSFCKNTSFLAFFCCCFFPKRTSLCHDGGAPLPVISTNTSLKAIQSPDTALMWRSVVFRKCSSDSAAGADGKQRYIMIPPHGTERNNCYYHFRYYSEPVLSGKYCEQPEFMWARMSDEVFIACRAYIRLSTNHWRCFLVRSLMNGLHGTKKEMLWDGCGGKPAEAHLSSNLWVYKKCTRTLHWHFIKREPVYIFHTVPYGAPDQPETGLNLPFNSRHHKHTCFSAPCADERLDKSQPDTLSLTWALTEVYRLCFWCFKADHRKIKKHMKSKSDAGQQRLGFFFVFLNGIIDFFPLLANK